MGRNSLEHPLSLLISSLDKLGFYLAKGSFGDNRLRRFQNLRFWDDQRSSVYVSALRLDSGELLIVITPESCPTAVSDYGKRWGIETLFGMFKTRGFCLESTHFRDSERLSKLVALMTLALCWAVKTGEWLHRSNPIKVKKHGRLAKSIFRYGLDHLRSIVTDLDLKQDEFLHSLQFLSCT